MKLKKKLYGWFDSPGQEKPAYDPPKICLFCTKPLGFYFDKSDVQCISLMGVTDKRSYFYRVHKACYESATPEEITLYESSIIDNSPTKP